MHRCTGRVGGNKKPRWIAPSGVSFNNGCMPLAASLSVRSLSAWPLWPRTNSSRPLRGHETAFSIYKEKQDIERWGLYSAVGGKSGRTYPKGRSKKTFP